MRCGPAPPAWVLAAAMGVVPCAGCSSIPAPPPMPGSAQSGSPNAPYIVHPVDVLAVKLYLTPELNEEVAVRPDGRIDTQLAEAVPAAGLTPTQIAASLRIAYASELKDPRIVVEVKSAAPPRVYVAGEVAAPGEFSSTSVPPSLLQAVARAGGLKFSGDPDHVFIVRRSGTGRPVVLATRYADAFSGRDASADVPLQPFDIVIVPRTGIAEVYVWVNQHIQQFTPVSWGFSYNLNPLVNSSKP